MRSYELVYIVKPDVEEEALVANSQRVRQLIESNGGQLSEVQVWGKRRLAYHVRGYEDGHYTLVRFQLDPQKVQGLERSLRLTEEVIRHLVVSVES